MFGMVFMIAGLAGIVFKWGALGQVIAAFGMVIGAIMMLASMGIYFAAGMMSTSATVVVCPECGKATKIIGKTDRCMFCKTILSLDPAHAPQAKEQADADKEVEQASDSNNGDTSNKPTS